MIRINNITVPLDFNFANLQAFATKRFGLPQSALLNATLAKKSVDARDKRDVHFVISLEISAQGDEADLLKKLPNGAQIVQPSKAQTTRPALPLPLGTPRPLVDGLGPAGLFAAHTLAAAGLRPIVVERGRPVDRREIDVRAFWAGGALNTESNVQFGEGGAGAFSDGKLTTGIKDARVNEVLRLLCECGAPEEILYLAKPHIGTDRLPGVVRALRERMIALGADVLFETRLEGLALEDGRVRAATLVGPDGTQTIPVESVLLAVGHSARDTFEMLKRLGVPMTRKPFSIGARIEHKQALIDRSQYRAFAGHPALPAAEYKLSCHLKNGRSAYTFCMCPGGQVVAAASELGGVVTNGMSSFARDGENANAALLVDMLPEDIPGDDPLSGIDFQRAWERRAFTIGGGFLAPAQRVGDFLQNTPSGGAGDVEPTYRPGVVYTSLHDCLPPFVTEAMRAAIAEFDRKLCGFADRGALLTGVETRSSSPVRVLRGEDCQSAIRGLYPCGEGAGYAGGILSAAADGIRCADQIINGISTQ